MRCERRPLSLALDRPASRIRSVAQPVLPFSLPCCTSVSARRTRHRAVSGRPPSRRLPAGTLTRPPSPRTGGQTPEPQGQRTAADEDRVWRRHDPRAAQREPADVGRGAAGREAAHHVLQRQDGAVRPAAGSRLQPPRSPRARGSSPVGIELGPACRRPRAPRAAPRLGSHVRVLRSPGAADGDFTPICHCLKGQCPPFSRLPPGRSCLPLTCHFGLRSAGVPSVRAGVAPRAAGLPQTRCSPSCDGCVFRSRCVQAG